MPCRSHQESNVAGPPLNYRTDIEGLRAVAVIPVVFSHAGLGPSGGFAGVDIFFVISGYLITGVILAESKERRFSLADFYRRRIARIFPALFAMLAVTGAVGTAVLLPGEIRDLSGSMVSAIIFSSNLFFWLHSGYFQPIAESQPLLHTWSLAVEEQFYIIFPVLLLVIQRSAGRHLASLLWLLAATSFAVSIWASYAHPRAAFYLLPARFWELALGAVLAAGGSRPVNGGYARHLLSGLGLGLVLYGLVALTPADPFPGFNALYPCFGTFLLLAYGQGAFTERLLRWTPLTFIGRISYSLYLWHWPIIVFLGLWSPLASAPSMIFVALASSFIFAVLSFRYIELPMRGRISAASPQRALVGATGIVLLFSAATWSMVPLAASFRRYPDDIARLLVFEDYFGSPAYVYQYRAGRCFIVGDDLAAYDSGTCLRLDASRRNFLLIGDSHAAFMWRALSLTNPGVNLLQKTSSGCAPLRNAPAGGDCAASNRMVFDDFLRSQAVQGVILGRRWMRGELGMLRDTIAYLRGLGLTVVVLGPTVEYQGSLPGLVARARLANDPERVSRARDRSREALSLELEETARRAGARYVSLHDLICPGGTCVTTVENGDPMAFDYGHLTLSGSMIVALRMGPL